MTEKQEIQVFGYTIFVTKETSLRQGIIELDRRFIPVEHLEVFTEMFGDEDTPRDIIFDDWYKNELKLEHDETLFADPLFSGCDNE